MSVERPLRQEIMSVVRDVVAEAEALRLPKSAYTWHRRFSMGIDLSIEAARRRSQETSSLLSKLHKSAEMANCWLQGQRERPGSYERTRLMNEAWGIFQELTG